MNKNTNIFDKSSVEAVINEVIENEPNFCIVIKFVVPVGLINKVSKQFDSDAARSVPATCADTSLLEISTGYPTKDQYRGRRGPVRGVVQRLFFDQDY